MIKNSQITLFSIHSVFDTFLGDQHILQHHWYLVNCVTAHLKKVKLFLNLGIVDTPISHCRYTCIKWQKVFGQIWSLTCDFMLEYSICLSAKTNLKTDRYLYMNIIGTNMKTDCKLNPTAIKVSAWWWPHWCSPV